jgi:hypothetical protein
LSKADPFKPFKIKEEEGEQFTAVSCVSRYKKWIWTRDGMEGYCYLKIYKYKYCPYAFMLYGRYPELGQLNLSADYLSEAFDELNIAVNYGSNMFHVYQHTNVTYPPGFEKINKNREIVDNPWHGAFIVGATTTIAAGGSISTTPTRIQRTQVITDDHSRASGSDSDAGTQTQRHRGRLGS